MQVLPSLRGGGVERGTLEVADALVKAGHRSIVVSGGGPMTAELRSAGSEHIELPVGAKSLKSLVLIRKLRQLWSDEGVDIVHARSRVPAWLSYLAWRNLPLASRPHFITTVHGAYSANSYSAVMLKGERVIAVSETIADYVRQSYPRFDSSRMTVIHRGVDPDDFPFGYRPTEQWLREWHDQYPELAGKKIVTLVGRLTRLKGHHDLFDLVEQLNQADGNVHGLIVGQAEAGARARYARALEAECTERALPITFTGHRSDIKEIYATSDLVVSLSSQPESFGRSVLEALSLGRPVLGYNHGGVGEVLRALYPRGAIELHDTRNLFAAAAKCLSEQPANAALVQPDRFPLSTMLEQTLALYTDICAQ